MYDKYPDADALEFIRESREETISLIKELAAIPAPTGSERRRAEFVLDFFKRNGMNGAYIDAATNVICPVGFEDKGGNAKAGISVFAAHMDIVHNSTNKIPIMESNGRLYAPGIGDDTANLVQLMICAKYVASNIARGAIVPKRRAIFAATACEEGLGNLNGCRALMDAYGSQVCEFTAFDTYIGTLVNDAVGSHRYEVSVSVPGGHSYYDFGRPNAINILSGIIRMIYSEKLPQGSCSTFNVGRIEGGTTVNSIAQNARMLFEYRFKNVSGMEDMKSRLESAIRRHCGEDVQISIKKIGDRPCAARQNPRALDALTMRNARIIKHYTGVGVIPSAGSSDANIPLSLGIPAVQIGAVSGGGMHTADEYIEKQSLITGQKIALAAILGGIICLE